MSDPIKRTDLMPEQITRCLYEGRKVERAFIVQLVRQLAVDCESRGESPSTSALLVRIADFLAQLDDAVPDSSTN